MKVKTWVPQKRKISKTLADVPSGPESHVCSITTMTMR